MHQTLFNSVIFSVLVVFSLLTSQSSLAEDGYKVVASKTFSTRLKTQQPIDIGLEVNGVRLNSIFFDKDKMEAFLIFRNRTPVKVTTEVGVALFDSSGKLVATGIDVTGFSFSGDSVGAGEQKNVKLAFARFINDYSEARSFQLVFTIVEADAKKRNYRSHRNVD
ncbi:MAG: hypothetical protein CSA50_07445 [Gammaproteobacteria bacterium]|nr:MAG: hypothetical protein CSA50_07445 [Gammaproteobacteria bacterium]